MRTKAWLALATLVLLLPGCGTTPPEEVVQAYMQALAAFDAEGMAAQACPELSQAILESREQVDIAGESGMVIGVSELSYETVAEDAENAVVRIMGIVTWAGADEEVDEDLSVVKVEDEWKLCEAFK